MDGRECRQVYVVCTRQTTTPGHDGHAAFKSSSLPRHDGTRADLARTFSDAGEKFTSRAPFVGAAAGDQKAVLASDDVALAQRRIILDLDDVRPT